LHKSIQNRHLISLGTVLTMNSGRGDAQRDADPSDGRNETQTERLDRNWSALLQELRVLETGTQILTGFLLTVAFQSAFSKLDGFEKGLYLVLVSLAALSTILVLTPVALHRALFRQKAMDTLVRWADRLLRASLLIAGLAIVGVAALLFRVAAGPLPSVLAAVGAAVVLGAAWFALPFGLRRRERG
jgi:hypothetical protein